MEDFKEIITAIIKFIPLIAAGVALYTWRGNAAAKFRSAIDPEIADSFSGHALHQALLGSMAENGRPVEGTYAKHRRAFKEFRRFLGPVGRRKVNEAWQEYNGGNEETPDFFNMYCLANLEPGMEMTEKQKLLKKRLEKLHDVSSIWY